MMRWGWPWALLNAIYRNQEGTTAVEFAIIAPVFLLLILGTIGLPNRDRPSKHDVCRLAGRI